MKETIGENYKLILRRKMMKPSKMFFFGITSNRGGRLATYSGSVRI